MTNSEYPITLEEARELAKYYLGPIEPNSNRLKEPAQKAHLAVALSKISPSTEYPGHIANPHNNPIIARLLVDRSIGDAIKDGEREPTPKGSRTQFTTIDECAALILYASASMNPALIQESLESARRNPRTLNE